MKPCLCFLLLLLLCLSSCSSPVTTAANTDLGLKPTVPAVSEEAVVTEEEALDETIPVEKVESSGGVGSKTYTHLSGELSDGVYYLRYIKSYPQDTTRADEEFVLASNGSSLYIRERALGFVYLLQGEELFVLNEKDKTYTKVSLEGKEIDLSSYLDWTVYSDYEASSYTSETAGTKRKPKVTETFSLGERTLSFLFTSDQLTSVSATLQDGSQWLATVKEFHGKPAETLFVIPSDYTGK